LTKISRASRVIDVPNATFDLREEDFQAFTTVSDFEKSVQKTFNNGDGDK
jgi:hypothetical protein